MADTGWSDTTRGGLRLYPGRRFRGGPWGRGVAALALSGLSACAGTWRPVSDADLRASPRRQVRVTVTGSPEPIVVRNPRVIGDSLVGTRVAASRDALEPRVPETRVAVPVAAVTRAEEYFGNTGGTVALLLLLVVGVAGLVGYSYLSGLNT
jgi:hypothetical protein